jgi:myo-inositol-1(or 4)-monophosphatase
MADLDPRDLDALLAIARETGDAASQLLRQARPADVRTKSNPHDLVTEWDVRSEEVIRGVLAVRTPDIPVLGEEGGAANEGVDAAPRRWVVDPIDATVNFAHGLPLWAVSIALEVDGQPVVGVVEAPALGWTFWARAGGGAFVDQGAGAERMAVSSVASLGRGLLATGFPYDRATSAQNNFAQWEHFQRVATCRRCGAASLDLCFVARGWFEGYWERWLKSWDLSAGALIVVEAGGRVTDTRGGPFVSASGEVVATNGAIHEEMLAQLAVADARAGTSTP